MPLSADPVPRIRKHTRSVRFDGHARADGASGQFRSAAVQVLAGEQRDNHGDGRKPFELDRCHAPETGDAAVRLYYPGRRREAKTGTD